MEILIKTITFLFLLGLILSPIFILIKVDKLNVRFKFIIYLIIGIITSALIMFAFAWWSNKSDLILLKFYGYNIDGMNETEFYGKVLPENMDKVKNIETSIMGIGWPLKAIMSFPFYITYLFVVFFVYSFVKKLKNSKIQNKIEKIIENENS